MIRIGYPCINRTIGCRSDKTFRLTNFNIQNFKRTVEENLKCLLNILDYNISKKIFFFRISSETIPFASHPINKINWQNEFRELFKEISKKIKNNNIRVSMHPDQFVVLNSPNKDVVKRSIDELLYHLELLEALETDYTAKIQIHLGGGYGDKKEAKKRFIENYKKLPIELKKRLVIENDERIYNIDDCIQISQNISIPIVVDYLHDSINKSKKDFFENIKSVSITWKEKDGPPIIDYSSQKINSKTGMHSETIDEKDFESFILKLLENNSNYDIMLEIKDKEKSAIKAIKILEKINKKGGLWNIQK